MITVTVSGVTGTSLASAGVFTLASLINSYYIDSSLAITSFAVYDSSSRLVNNYPSVTSNMIIATTTPNVLTSATLTQASNVTNTATTYTFSVQNTNLIPSGAKI